MQNIYIREDLLYKEIDNINKLGICIITTPVILTAYLRGLIHRVRVYAFGIPTCIHVWYTPKTLA